ncbi:MAG: PQQ-binding-like beta-propeller repeat protein, partial [Candidatus Bathyarchaeia archaeon]
VNITAGNPVLCCFNMTQALWDSGNSFEWGPSLNGVINFGLGVMWAEPVPTQINGVPISPTLTLGMSGSFSETVLTGNTVFLASGVTHAAAQQGGYIILAGMSQTDGSVLFCKNYTYPDYQCLQPFLNVNFQVINGLMVWTNTGNWKMDAIDGATGNKVWETTLTTPYGDGTPNIYARLGGLNFLAQANGVLGFYSFGGDLWGINATTGKQIWYTNTTTLFGNPGVETPYGVWPLWTFPGDQCYSNDTVYCAIGHEYDPPLFHGAQLLAVNLTNGNLIWNELGFYTVSLSTAFNTVFALNCYDNQIYAFAKGPSDTTVSAPNVGVTTATPITIAGTVTDISPGTQQSAVKLNFPNGVPCVSDASESKFMEYVYQSQPEALNTTGVPVTLSVIDANNNFRTIGTTTSDASGHYSYTWTPDIPGNYTIIASFAGSNSYYGSTAEANFYASLPTATSAATAAPVTGFATSSDVMYVGVAMIVVIIIIGAVLALLMTRKR